MPKAHAKAARTAVGKRAETGGAAGGAEGDGTAAPFGIDPEALAELAEIGCTRVEAAAWLGLSAADMRSALRDGSLKAAWARGALRGRVRIRRAQFALAERNASMASLLGRVYLGQSNDGAASIGRVSLHIDTGIERDEDPQD